MVDNQREEDAVDPQPVEQRNGQDKPHDRAEQRCVCKSLQFLKALQDCKLTVGKAVEKQHACQQHKVP